MKLTQSKLDILSAYPDQLIAMRHTIRTFDRHYLGMRTKQLTILPRVGAIHELPLP